MSMEKESTPVKQVVHVAAVDFVPAWGDLNGNITRLVSAIETVAKQEVDYAVFPETAVCGYLFTDFAELAPYLDTIPGKMTEAVLPVLSRTGMYVSVGIAELDNKTGLAYNTAVLMGPNGIIGSYRKNGLNGQDQRVFSPGNMGVPVFETPIGRIALLICFDDTYWQYARLAMLAGAQIIGWHSVSDRVMPSASKAEKIGDHSTVSHVQYISAQNGVWVVCATRSGTETNPISRQQLFYNGGSSIWAPTGHKVAQAPVVPPEILEPGLNGVYTAVIDLSEADAQRAQRLAKRRPDLYHPTLALHRALPDVNASQHPITTTLIAAQWSETHCGLDQATVEKDALLVLPAFSALPYSADPDQILASAETQDGAFEQRLRHIASAGSGYVVGSYPEKTSDKLYHTVVLAGPEGKILGRYRVTHTDTSEGWATAGDRVVVVQTPIGRIALAAAHELQVAELIGMFSALRADIVAAPASLPSNLKVEIDAELYAVANPPTGRADFYPYATAALQQLWVVTGGRSHANQTSAGIYGPEPIVLTPTILADIGAPDAREKVEVPSKATWMSQGRLIASQRAYLFPPLTQ